jgi:hypothetical protein
LATAASTSSTVKAMRRIPSVFGAAFVSPSRAAGLLNCISSRRPLPSAVCSIEIWQRTSSSPTTRSTHSPATSVAPTRSSPRSTKNSSTAARSSTTMPMFSSDWIEPLISG